MMKTLLVTLTGLVFAMGISGCGGNGVTPAMQEAITKKETMVVQRNMWWGPGRWPGMKVIYTTNYKMGPMIPVNAKVTLEAMNKNQVSFHYNGNLIILRNMPKHTNTDMGQMMARYFGTKSVDLSKFTQLERDNIKQGTLAVGMSKEAALIARGYPPSHKTPSLDADTWQYWKFQAGYTSDTILVHFKAGKISGFTD
jgi:hypothetical protein